MHDSEAAALKLYCALFWIQGKTDIHEDEAFSGLYCALFWIQGKTEDCT